MVKNERNILNMSITILSAWSGLMFVLYALLGVSWFHLGDFSFRTAMAYPGILIPAWMMLALAYSRPIELSYLIMKWLGKSKEKGNLHLSTLTRSFYIRI